MTYSVDFRKKVLSIKTSQGLSFAKTAKLFGLSITTLVSWSKRITPLRNRRKPATKINMEALLLDIKASPDAFQYERAKRLGVSQTGIWFALKRLKVSYKKNSDASKGRSRKKIYILPEA